MNRLAGECALGKLKLPLILVQPLQNLSEMINVCLPGWTVDENVVEEDDDKLPQARSQSDVHGPLKGTRRAIEAKRHDSELILAEVSLKCCFMFLSGLQQNLRVENHLALASSSIS
jgi:hypothetical protein